MKILIRGAGDLATGIASRLYGAGHKIIMTDIAVPLTVRRTVALSRAVYDGKAVVENLEGFRVENQEKAEAVLAEGGIPVLVDPEASCREWYQPDVIVDAILAKRNLGTKISDAPFVIGVGPGFSAGEDCNCVVETKRGHTLGKIIWQGAAIPNTGVPGNVGGFTIERLLKATADGEIQPLAQIGDYVELGQTVAITGGEPVKAKMTGIIRGMLQDNVPVQTGLKIGDIDARAERSHCFTISDKARAIGGGVLEAVTCYERQKGKYALVLLAAGKSSRFEGNKLQEEIRGKKMYEIALERLQAFSGFRSYVVTGSEEIAEKAEALGIQAVCNKEPEKGIALSLHLGLGRAMQQNPELDGVMFSVCDQPELSIATMQKILNTASWHRGSIVCAGKGEKTGNPVLWSKKYFEELLTLTGDKGGSRLMSKYAENVRIIQTEQEELRDVDYREDLKDIGYCSDHS